MIAFIIFLNSMLISYYPVNKYSKMIFFSREDSIANVSRETFAILI